MGELGAQVREAVTMTFAVTEPRRRDPSPAAHPSHALAVHTHLTLDGD